MRTFFASLVLAVTARAQVLDPAAFRHYADEFYRDDPSHTAGAIPDREAWDWMRANVPLLSVPDAEFERIYYYRWWAFRKHIVATPAGWVITEFLRPVKHATQYNAISCALGLHIAEGRWLRDRRYLDDYLAFWLRGGPGGGLEPHYHQFSNWTASAVYDRWLADGDTARLTALLDPLIADYRAWESERLTPSGLFWQRDVSDGMEESISGGRNVRNLRPTINSYQYANAKAIAAIAGLAGRRPVRAEFEAKARELRRLTQETLWNAADGFFETVLQSGGPAKVRELIGYTPWAFDLPEPGRGYEIAWKQVTDPRGFAAPFGLTTAEQRHPQFKIARTGDDCQWNGPAWPFATSVTLSAMANVLNRYPQQAISPRDYFAALATYVKSQHRKLDDGRTIPWIDENLDPFTGIWHARDLKLQKGTFYGRGDHYNHSAFADLVISGLAGLRPREDQMVEVRPLVPEATWDWFCLDAVPYHGKLLTILWDRTGARFHKGAGLSVFADGRQIAHSAVLERVVGSLQ
jgi:hypothetical protein